MIQNQLHMIGCNSVLGNEITRRFRSEGYFVNGIGRGPKRNPIVDEYTSLDVEEEGNCRPELFAPYEGTHNVVVLGVGNFPIRRLISEDKGHAAAQTFASNVGTFLNVFSAIKPHLNRASFRIVTFGSVSEPYHYPMLGIYTACKAALKATIRTLAHEHAADPVAFFHFNLSTIDDPKETQFTFLDQQHKYLSPEAIADAIFSYTTIRNPVVQYSELDLYAYDENYYAEGYFQRVPKVD